LILWLSFKGLDDGIIIVIDVYKLKNIESITWYKKYKEYSEDISYIYILIIVNICIVIYDYI